MFNNVPRVQIFINFGIALIAFSQAYSIWKENNILNFYGLILGGTLVSLLSIVALLKSKKESNDKKKSRNSTTPVAD